MVVDLAAAEVGLDPLLVRAIIQVESSWRPRVESEDGAVGLMQILPSTAGEYLRNPDLRDPVVNIAIGVAHLSMLVEKHGVVGALGAWNAGEGALRRRQVFRTFGETRRFVARVLRELERLRSSRSLPADGDPDVPDGWEGGVTVVEPGLTPLPREFFPPR